MEYQRKSQRPAPATRQASTHTPDPPALTHLEAQRHTLQRFTASPQTAQCHRAEGIERQRLDARAFGKFPATIRWRTPLITASAVIGSIGNFIDYIMLTGAASLL